MCADVDPFFQFFTVTETQCVSYNIKKRKAKQKKNEPASSRYLFIFSRSTGINCHHSRPLRMFHFQINGKKKFSSIFTVTAIVAAFASTESTANADDDSYYVCCYCYKRFIHKDWKQTFLMCTIEKIRKRFYNSFLIFGLQNFFFIFFFAWFYGPLAGKTVNVIVIPIYFFFKLMHDDKIRFLFSCAHFILTVHWLKTEKFRREQNVIFESISIIIIWNEEEQKKTTIQKKRNWIEIETNKNQ